MYYSLGEGLGISLSFGELNLLLTFLSSCLKKRLLCKGGEGAGNGST